MTKDAWAAPHFYIAMLVGKHCVHFSNVITQPGYSRLITVELCWRQLHGTDKGELQSSVGRLGLISIDEYLAWLGLGVGPAPWLR